MAELETTGNSPRRKGAGVRKSKKLSTRIDLTPMVDLGFLLITFFMYTTTLAKPQSMEIQMPIKNSKAEPTEIKRTLALTILLSRGHQLFTYEGMAEDPYEPPVLKPVSIARNTEGLRQVLLSKKASVESLKVNGVIPATDNVFILIKPDSNSEFKDLVDVFDELAISGIKDYAKVDITEKDRDLIRIAQQEKN